MQNNQIGAGKAPQRKPFMHHKFVLMGDGTLMEMNNTVPTEEQMHAINQARLKN